MNYLDEPSDLASISAVLRDLHASTLPLLYKNISWEWDSVPLARILPLLRKVIQNPDIALFIQHVALVSPQKNVEQHDWKNEKVKDDLGWKDDVSKFNNVIELVQGVIKKAEFSEDAVPKWNSATEGGNAYAFVAIFLSTTQPSIPST